MNILLVTNNTKCKFENLKKNLCPSKVIETEINNDYTKNLARLALEVDKEIFFNRNIFDIVFYAVEDDTVMLNQIKNYQILTKIKNYLVFTKKGSNDDQLRYQWHSEKIKILNSNFFCSPIVFSFFSAIYKFDHEIFYKNLENFISNGDTSNYESIKHLELFHLLKVLNVNLFHLYYDR